jgi:hypothetical protein
MKAKIIDFILTILTSVILVILLLRAIEKENNIQQSRLEYFLKHDKKEINLCQMEL